MSKLDYQKWHPTDPAGTYPLNTGCGNLLVDIYSESYDTNYAAKKILYRKATDQQYYLDEGTLHYVKAIDKEYQVGHFEVTLYWYFGTFSLRLQNKKYITFDIEILDCFIKTFRSPEQTGFIENLVIDID